jgi:hypothetical protein
LGPKYRGTKQGPRHVVDCRESGKIMPFNFSSDAFGAALWTPDAALSMAYLQVNDALFSGLPHALYGPLMFDAQKGWTVGPTVFISLFIL